MQNTPCIDSTQIVPDSRVRAQDTVGEEGGGGLIGSPKHLDTDASSQPVSTTPRNKDVSDRDDTATA